MRVGVVGAAGYAGGELLRLLLGHPSVTGLPASEEDAGTIAVTDGCPSSNRSSSPPA